jgi:hypothetical protein
MMEAGELMPGIIALMGSGETTYNGGQIFEAVAKTLPMPLVVSVLETPAGFELNSDRVAGRVADFLKVRLQNYRPSVHVIPARKKGTQFSPDDINLLKPMLDSHFYFLGPGSPTYTVRQLKDSLAWGLMQALYRSGTAAVLASAAVISLGRWALPVYEIYKVGEDAHWKPGLDFFGPFGLSLIFIPHWNNAEGGGELDTTRCFVGKQRFDELLGILPCDCTILGIDEHTGVVIDLEHGTCQVLGKDSVHILRAGQLVAEFKSGERFDLALLGKYIPLSDPADGLLPEVWQMVYEHQQQQKAKKELPPEIPAEVLQWVVLRQQARSEKDWGTADKLRHQITEAGYQVKDSPTGPLVEPLEL